LKKHKQRASQRGVAYCTMQESTGCKSWCTAMLQFRHASHLRHATVWTPPDPPRAPPAQKPTRIRRPDWLRRKHSHPGVRQVNRAASQRSCLRSGQAPHVQKPVHMHWSGWLRRKSHVSGMAGQPSSLTARSSLRTGGQADGDGRDLLRVQAGDLVGDARRAQVPEAQRAVKVAADGQAAVQAHAHAVHAGVAHQRALAEAARQVPHLCDRVGSGQSGWATLCVTEAAGTCRRPKRCTTSVQASREAGLSTPCWPAASALAQGRTLMARTNRALGV